MKKLIFFLAAASVSFAPAFATPADSAVVEQKFAEIETSQRKIASDVKALSESQAKDAEALQAKIDELNSQIATIQANLKTTADAIGVQIKDAQTSIDTNAEQSNTLFRSARTLAIVLAAVLLAIVAVVYFMMRRRITRGSDSIAEIRRANEKLQEQSVALDEKLADLMSKQLSMADKVSAPEDHSLVLKIANEVARIEQNLNFMDPKTKGVSQLRNRANAITEELRKKGYEMPSLIGTEYKEGYNMEATVEEDDTIEPGKMIIRRVNRPAVLFNGKMIQCAQVVVAFNPED